MMKFTVPGKALAMQVKKGRGGRRFYSKKTMAYWHKIGLFALARTGRPTKEDIKLSLACYFPDKNYPDMDNVARIYLNAFKKIVYYDDAQVADLHIRRIVDKNERERVDVEIEAIK